MEVHASVRAIVDIYERDPAERELLEKWLSQAGYRVRERGGSRAQPNSPVDLVILAAQVPTHQALGLIRTMRVIYPTTAFLLVSKQPGGDPNRADAARTVDATRVLSKPLRRQELLDAVHAVIGATAPPPHFN